MEKMKAHNQLINKEILMNHSDMDKVLCNIKDELKYIKNNQNVLINN